MSNQSVKSVKSVIPLPHSLARVSILNGEEVRKGGQTGQVNGDSTSRTSRTLGLEEGFPTEPRPLLAAPLLRPARGAPGRGSEFPQQYARAMRAPVGLLRFLQAVRAVARPVNAQIISSLAFDGPAGWAIKVQLRYSLLPWLPRVSLAAALPADAAIQSDGVGRKRPDESASYRVTATLRDRD